MCGIWFICVYANRFCYGFGERVVLEIRHLLVNECLCYALPAFMHVQVTDVQRQNMRCVLGCLLTAVTPRLNTPETSRQQADTVMHGPHAQDTVSRLPSWQHWQIMILMSTFLQELCGRPDSMSTARRRTGKASVVGQTHQLLCIDMLSTLLFSSAGVHSTVWMCASSAATIMRAV